MIETQQEFTLRGKLKMAALSKTSVNGDEYYSTPLEVEETEKDGQKVENEVDSIMLIFWKKNFDTETQKTIFELKENQNVSVYGHYAGRDNGLFRVTKLLEVEKDDENDLYI